MPAQYPGNAISKAARAKTGGGFESDLPIFAANYPLQIIQPQPNLTTKNRFYKAYPGLEYNVRMGVLGGLYPFVYELTTAPTGMVIDSITGEISWPNPSASGTPYDVTAKVTDAEGTIQTVSWTVLVTTSGFLFVDAVNGTSTALGGTGTFGNPWKSLKDVYGGIDVTAMRANFNAESFVYWRAGTYQMDAFIEDNGSDGLETPIRGETKPLVWLGYPGDAKPVFNMLDAHLYFDGNGSDVYLDGLDIRCPNARNMGIKIASTKDNVVVRRNLFSGITAGFQGGNNALLFINLWTEGQYYAIQDNEFSDVQVAGYGILNYNTKNVLVEDNLYTDIADHPVGMKVRSEMWAVRGNRFRNNPNQCIELHYNNNGTDYSGDIEICYNVIESGGGDIHVNRSYESIGYPVHIYRNTLVDGATQKYVTSTNGPFYWRENVIINDSTDPDKITKIDVNATARLVIENNLIGTAADNIVDANGDLTAAYSEFVGSRGHQVVRN